ncbi:HEAT repeat-containing protein [Tieghemostelium lacteum]|uniref:HEAT repeat-containing protein n=1 Tax=Tieghemostelium lacteum TaxID=361077 RepID=A0A152A564_TIELA|nr:HEAT repeat-containing protein [Tieghemostelium lacteum]|eukprot:KYR01364.1 HEAT repeat-containing protein [Tieghemostelium lacteum]
MANKNITKYTDINEFYKSFDNTINSIFNKRRPEMYISKEFFRNIWESYKDYLFSSTKILSLVNSFLQKESISTLRNDNKYQVLFDGILKMLDQLKFKLPYFYMNGFTSRLYDCNNTTGINLGVVTLVHDYFNRDSITLKNFYNAIETLEMNNPITSKIVLSQFHHSSFKILGCGFTLGIDCVSDIKSLEFWIESNRPMKPSIENVKILARMVYLDAFKFRDGYTFNNKNDLLFLLCIWSLKLLSREEILSLKETYISLLPSIYLNELKHGFARGGSIYVHELKKQFGDTYIDELSLKHFLENSKLYKDPLNLYISIGSIYSMGLKSKILKNNLQVVYRELVNQCKFNKYASPINQLTKLLNRIIKYFGDFPDKLADMLLDEFTLEKHQISDRLRKRLFQSNPNSRKVIPVYIKELVDSKDINIDLVCLLILYNKEDVMAHPKLEKILSYSYLNTITKIQLASSINQLTQFIEKLDHEYRLFPSLYTKLKQLAPETNYSELFKKVGTIAPYHFIERNVLPIISSSMEVEYLCDGLLSPIWRNRTVSNGLHMTDLVKRMIDLDTFYRYSVFGLVERYLDYFITKNQDVHPNFLLFVQLMDDLKSFIDIERPIQRLLHWWPISSTANTMVLARFMAGFILTMSIEYYSDVIVSFFKNSKIQLFKLVRLHIELTQDKRTPVSMVLNSKQSYNTIIIKSILSHDTLMSDPETLMLSLEFFKSLKEDFFEQSNLPRSKIIDLFNISSDTNKKKIVDLIVEHDIISLSFLVDLKSTDINGPKPPYVQDSIIQNILRIFYLDGATPNSKLISLAMVSKSFFKESLKLVLKIPRYYSIKNLIHIDGKWCLLSNGWKLSFKYSQLQYLPYDKVESFVYRQPSLEIDAPIFYRFDKELQLTKLIINSNFEYNKTNFTSKFFESSLLQLLDNCKNLQWLDLNIYTAFQEISVSTILDRVFKNNEKSLMHLRFEFTLCDCQEHQKYILELLERIEAHKKENPMFRYKVNAQFYNVFHRDKIGECKLDYRLFKYFTTLHLRNLFFEKVNIQPLLDHYKEFENIEHLYLDVETDCSDDYKNNLYLFHKNLINFLKSKNKKLLS